MEFKKPRRANNNLAIPERRWLLLAVLALALVFGLLAFKRLFLFQPNVLLISVDTLRPDRLGCYGYGLDTSPNIDRLAEQGFTFGNCYASSSWTMPSVMSIHTGLYPFHHGVQWVDSHLPEEMVTLAERFKERGYDTGAVESSLFLQGHFGFAQGFDHYVEKPVHDHRAVSSPYLTEKAIDWLGRKRQKPFFLWVHYLDPHYDYLFHEKAAEFARNIPEQMLNREFSILELKEELYSLSEAEYRAQNQLYDGEINYTDQFIGRILDFLRELNMARDTWVILTSDHGEMLGEHGALGHTEWYYEPVLRVPLIIKPPREVANPVRIETPVSLVDIAPTLLDLLGMDYDPEMFDGRALLEQDGRESSGDENRLLWAQTRTPVVDFTVQTGTPKLVIDRKRGELLALSTEGPEAESENLAEQHQQALEEFKKLAETLNEKSAGVDSEADEELLDQIRAQGYLGGGPERKPTQ